ncbi:hypothetical protein GDO81_028708 [Engystomops pustulosus]|uniref:Uncharacterized protein n=1 Tax=Engystomops pustulosus TaxID=76066 RepID=A0AAV6YDH1_ENGPU|nr:hypothetical protein GDO81_028708 [Engystomops pustulosus]
MALREVLQLVEGKRANIYTQGIVLGSKHDYEPIWKARDFLTSAGTPFKHGTLVIELMDALLLPQEVRIVKLKAHTIW